MTARDEDPLLVAMRRAAAEEAERDARLASLEKLAEIDLAPEERRALEDEAARTPEGADLAVLLRPIDAPARSRAAAAALAALRGEAAGSQKEGILGAGAAAPLESDSGNGAGSKREGVSSASAAAPTNVVPFVARAREKSAARPRAGRWAAIGGALAIAAGVALFVSTRGAGVELPVYEASLAGGVRDVRADDAARTFLPGKPLRVRLRPEHAVAGAVGAIVAVKQGDRVTRLDASIEALEGGAMALQATLPAVPSVQPGPAELIVLVAGARALPVEARPEEIADGPEHRVVRLAIVIGAP